MRSSELRGLAFGSAFAAACSTTATLGIELRGTTGPEGGDVTDAGELPEAAGDADRSDRSESSSDVATDTSIRADVAADAPNPVLPSFCSSYPRSTPQGGWESKAVFYGSDRK